MDPWKFSVQKFTVGEFPHYCILHPWRTGLVSVVSGHDHLPNVGSDFGDGANIFDLEYKFNRSVDRASIDESAKSISFELKGNIITDYNTRTVSSICFDQWNIFYIYRWGHNRIIYSGIRR